MRNAFRIASLILTKIGELGTAICKLDEEDSKFRHILAACIIVALIIGGGFYLIPKIAFTEETTSTSSSDTPTKIKEVIQNVWNKKDAIQDAWNNGEETKKKVIKKDKEEKALLCLMSEMNITGIMLCDKHFDLPETQNTFLSLHKQDILKAITLQYTEGEKNITKEINIDFTKSPIQSFLSLQRQNEGLLSSETKCKTLEANIFVNTEVENLKEWIFEGKEGETYKYKKLLWEKH